MTTGIRKLSHAQSAMLGFLNAAAFAAAVLTFSVARAQESTAITPIPIPSQVPVKDGMAEIPDTKLWYWDTGGTGAPVILMHPVTGSGLVWGYQQPVLAKVGYRVIAFSRRGYYNSAPFDKERRGYGSEDLRHLADFLKLDRFHLIASAAGGAIASDFAFSYPQRLLSLTISSSTFAVRSGPVVDAANFIRPKIWGQLPIEFRELGPAYRAANPEGVKAWLALEHKALIGPDFRQPLKNRIAQTDLRQLKVPTFAITGAADTTAPPPIMRMIAAEIPNSRLLIVPEAGHSPYWEQSQIFNRAVLEFLGGVPK